MPEMKILILVQCLTISAPS